MKRIWSEPELEEFWTLSPKELALTAGRTVAGQLGAALQLKFLQIEGQFPKFRRDIPAVVVRFVADQLGTHAKHFASYDLEGRSAQRDRKAVRQYAQYRQSNEADKKRMVSWLCDEILPRGPDPNHIEDLAITWLKNQSVEIPETEILLRLIKLAVGRSEDQLCSLLVAKLSEESKRSIDQLLESSSTSDLTSRRDADTHRAATLNEIKADPRRPSLETMFDEVAKLQRIDSLGLPAGLMSGVAPRIIDQYRRRAATEPPSELKQRIEQSRYALMSIYCWQRRREVLGSV